MNHNCHNYMDINEISIQKDIVRHQLFLLISAMIFLMQTQHQELLPNCWNFHLSLSVPQVRTLTRDFANFQLSAEQPQLKWGYWKQWKHGNIPTFQQKTVQAEVLKVQASSQRSGPGFHGKKKKDPKVQSGRPPAERSLHGRQAPKSSTSQHQFRSAWLPVRDRSEQKTIPRASFPHLSLVEYNWYACVHMTWKKTSCTWQ